jgi:hypothetical protein
MTISIRKFGRVKGLKIIGFIFDLDQVGEGVAITDARPKFEYSGIKGCLVARICTGLTGNNITPAGDYDAASVTTTPADTLSDVIAGSVYIKPDLLN